MSDQGNENTRLSDLKNLSFGKLCTKYQNANGNPIYKLRELEKSKANQNDKRALLTEFNKLSNNFIDYYEAFFHHYNVLFNAKCEHVNRATNSEYVTAAKIFTESCVVHITRINTKHIQPLSNAITINKAEKSIQFGLFSVILGVISILFSLFFSWSSNFQIKKFIDVNKNQFSELSHNSDVIKKLIDKQNNQLLKQNIVLQNRNDSLEKKIKGSKQNQKKIKTNLQSSSIEKNDSIKKNKL